MVTEAFMFSMGYLKILKYQNFMSIHAVGTELCRAGRVDRRDEANSLLFAILRRPLCSQNF